jgi:hypothetical protein
MVDLYILRPKAEEDYIINWFNNYDELGSYLKSPYVAPALK